ncbi:MAG: TerD family protein [Candidatus Competibacteraceae bacterium]|jgi:stress response protein SCP2|nr:TerD family protein [Candidatus Competibacteraceae bacterium]
MTSTTLQKGGNIGLNKVAPGITHINVALGWTPNDTPGMEVDGSAFLLAVDGKVRGDQDLVFYNNPRSSDGSVQVISESNRLDAQDTQLFELNLNAIPDAIQKIAFTVTIHEGQERQQNFGMLSSAWARVINAADQAELARFELPLAGTPETAMIFCEVYRHSGEWKFRAVGQGYVGGLEPLAISYGIDVAEDSAEASAAPPQPPSSPTPSPAASTPPTPSTAAPTTPPPSSTPPPSAETSPPPSAEPVLPPVQSEHGVRLEKRLVNLEKKDPQLVSLVKKVGVQLEKFGLEQHQAKVALCLDISGSMHGLYRKGSVNTLVTRVLALGLRFDDDGEIDVFLFGKGAYHAGTVNSDNYQTFVSDMLRRHPLEAGTAYGKVIEQVRNHYRDQPGFGQVPVYVMFATDGDTSDRPQTEQQIVAASQEGIFWQFMAIGTPPGEKKGFFSKLLSTDFSFLEYLDTMRNRFIDNASFFLVRDPAEPSDEELVKLMMAEYPTWLRGARSKGLLR